MMLKHCKTVLLILRKPIKRRIYCVLKQQYDTDKKMSSYYLL